MRSFQFENEVEYLLPNEENEMNKLKSAFFWFFLSSENANKISLTLKAGIPFLVLLGIGDTDTLQHLVGEIGVIIVSTGQVITGLITAYGLFRKIYNTAFA